MLETMLVLIAVVGAMVGVIVNRKSIIACVVTVSASAFLCLVFLILYANTHKFGSYGALVSVTIISSVILIAGLLAVTIIGVKMLKKKPTNADQTSTRDTSATYESATSGAVTPSFIPGTNVRPTPVGIFGRQPIRKAEPKPAIEPTMPEQPIAPVGASAQTQYPYATAPQPTPKPVTTQDDAVFARMLEKGAKFLAMEQYLLAEQMYVTYLQRCTDAVRQADAELLLLRCRIASGNKEKATETFTTLLGKLRAKTYEFTPEQKQLLAECKIDMMKM